MKLNYLFPFLLLFLLQAPHSRGEQKTIRGYKGYIEFSEEEKAEHRAGIAQVTKTSAACIRRHIQEQTEFWEMWKLSRFYGIDSDWNRKWTQEQREALFTRMHVPLKEMAKLKPINCIMMTLSCLEQGFHAAGQEAHWQKIADFTALNNKTGTSLQFALQRLGWKVLYWNPDTTKARDWDEEEKARDKKIREGNEPENQFYFYGFHEVRLASVRKSMMYLYNPVDDATTLIDYQRTIPEKFRRVPFFVGTVHSGFHVFPGTFGHVIEAHNKSRPTNRRTIEDGAFDTLHPREPHPNGGAYGRYRSGLIAVPPGYGF